MSADSDTPRRSRLTPLTAPSFVDNLDRILLAACAAIWLVALGAGVAATVALVDLGRGHQEASDGSSTPWLLYSVIGVSAAVIVAAVPLLLRARSSALKDRRPGRGSGGPPRTRGADEPPRTRGADEPPRTRGADEPPRTRGADQPPGVTESPAGNEAPTEKLNVLGSIAERFGARTKETPDAPDTARPPLDAPVVTRSTLDSPVAAVDQLWLRCTVLIGCATGAAMIAIAVATYLMAVGHNGAAWGLYGLAGVITAGMPAIPWLYLRQLRGLLESLAR